MRVREHIGFRGEEKRRRQVVLRCVAGAQRSVRLGHTSQLHIGVRAERVKPALHMPVHQAHNGHAQRRSSGLRMSDLTCK